MQLQIKHTGDISLILNGETEIILAEKVTFTKGQNATDDFIFSLKDDLLELLLSFIGIEFDKLMACSIQDGNVLSSVIKNQIIFQIESTIDKTVIETLRNKNIVSYSLEKAHD